MVPILLFLCIFGAALLQSVSSAANVQDIRISLPHIYAATFIASLSVFFYSLVCSPLPVFLWFLTVFLVVASVVAMRWQLFVDDKQWVQWATAEQSSAVLYTVATMNRTKNDKVRALAHSIATAAENTLKLLRHLKNVLEH
jgi:hypothetical protein